MDTVFNTGTLIGPEQATLRDILKALQDTYCGTLGVEYMYISSRAEKRWIQERLEPIRSKPSYSRRLQAPHPRAPHRGRGAGALPAHPLRRPEALLARRRRDADPGARQPAAARGRGRRAGAGDRHGAPRAPQRAGEHAWARCPRTCSPSSRASTHDSLLAGDVKYHQGFSSDINTPGGPMHLTLAFNPSHLEIVNPGGRGLGAGAPAPPQATAAATRCCRC